MFSIVDFKMLKNCSSDDIFVQFVWNYTYSSSFDFGENSTWVSYLPKWNKNVLWHEATEHQEVSVQSSRNLTTTVGSPEGKKLLIQILCLKQSWFVCLNGLWQKNWLQVEFLFCLSWGFWNMSTCSRWSIFSQARISLPLGRFFMNWMWKIKVQAILCDLFWDA